MLNQADFEVIISDASKCIDGNITWQTNPQHALWVNFRAEIDSVSGYLLLIQGSYNPIIDALGYHLIHPPYGRIYGLDLGKEHKNPDGSRIGEKHKHRWSEIYRDKRAYVPPDITAPASDPVKVWQQFCQEAAITHNGIMEHPPDQQLNLFI